MQAPRSLPAHGELLIHSRLDPGGSWRMWVLRAAVLAGFAGALYGVHRTWFNDLSRPHPRAQRVTLVSAPRTPPPKPPEKLPEPPREVRAQADTELATAAVQKRQADSPALGVDADAQGAGDGFGLVGKRGGRDITTLGDAPSSGPATPPGTRSLVAHANFGIYAGLVLQRLRVELAGDARLREHNYVAVAHIWIDERGRIVRCELSTGSGKLDTDSALRDAFVHATGLPEPPPNLPQPLRLRITSKEIEDSAPR